MTNLSFRRQRFVDEYTAAPANAAAAARKAGYSHRRAKVTASELLKVPEVARVIEEICLRQRAQHEYTRYNAANELLDIINGRVGSVGEQISAVRELGKLLGLYPTRNPSKPA